MYPQWGWATRDGDQVIAALMPYQNVTVFYGDIQHHAAMPDKGLGIRSVRATASGAAQQPREIPFSRE